MPILELVADPDEPPVDVVQLPQDVFMDMPSRDLLSRLLEIDPQKRLRSLRTLKTIAFYKGYSLDDVKEKKVRARDLLVKYFGENYQIPRREMTSFDGFDETLIVE